MKNIVIRHLINVFILTLIITSCKEDSVLDSKKTEATIYSEVIGDNSYEFEYDSLSSQFQFIVNQNTIYRQQYFFDKLGNLIEKRGLNFWGEEEKYFFDENNTLKEYRKLTKLDSLKYGLQEFIRYKNGLIDTSNSNFFTFEIIDSTDNEFNIFISYMGAFELSEMSIYINDFSYDIDNLNLNDSLISTKNKTISFWTKKNAIYQEEFGFLQLNVVANFENAGGLLMDVGNFGTKFMQTLILRKWR